jgi:copper chaperone CopZ
MMAVDICYHYETTLGEKEMRGIHRLQEVYGIRRLQLNENEKTILVEYDGTRLNEATVISLLRKTGLQVGRRPQAGSDKPASRAAPAQ